MDQPDNHQNHHLKQQKKNNPMFNVIEPSIFQAQLPVKRDASISSYLKPHHNKHHQQLNPHRTDDSEPEQISIFDAAKYFSGLHDHDHDHKGSSPNQHGSSKAHNLPSISRLSSVSSIDSSNYGRRSTTSNNRARSFHATLTASSEASYNSQSGLLKNPPGLMGISVVKNLSPNNSGGDEDNNATPRWPRISTKWLIPCRKCPCLGKKSVQVVEETTQTKIPKTPRMVDLRRSTSSNGTNASSWYSTMQNSPKKTGVGVTPLPMPPLQEPSDGNLSFNLMGSKLDHLKNKNPTGFSSTTRNPNGFSSLASNPNVGQVKSFVNGDDANGGATSNGNLSFNLMATKLDHIKNKNPSGFSSTNNNPNGFSSLGSNPKVGQVKSFVNDGATSNGFTFPILENPPINVKKMFSVIPSDHHQHHHHHQNQYQEPHSDSLELEVFQPRTHPSPKSRRPSYEDGNISDGSSDLFEIESFSTSTYLQRDSIDEGSSNLSSINVKRLGLFCPNNEIAIKPPPPPPPPPSECYAPSEVSIDWSVTTAEGYASEIGSPLRGGGAGGGDMGWRRLGGGGLLSCRCEKAVSVGPGPVKCAAEGDPPVTARHVGGRPLEKLQEEVAVTVHVSSKPGFMVGLGRVKV